MHVSNLLSRLGLSLVVVAITGAAGCIFQEFPEVHFDDAGSHVAPSDADQPDAADTADPRDITCDSNNDCAEQENAHESGQCNSGDNRCEFTCVGGYTSCDGNFSNGCETETKSAVQHCGDCNTACEPRDTHYARICVDGDCKDDSSDCAAGYVMDDDADGGSGCVLKPD